MFTKAFVRSVLALGVLLVGPAALGQQTRGAYRDVPEMPEGPIGQRIRGLLDTISANDPDKVRAFVDAQFTPAFRDFAPMEAHLQFFASRYEGSRGYEFHSIRQYEAATPPEEYVVIVRNQLTDAWEAFVMNIEREPPHRIAGLQFAPARPPSDLPPVKSLADEEVVRELEAFLRRVAEADAFSGTVLLAKGDKILFQGAYGQASKRFNVPNRIDTKFNLGSMNKMFTGVAITQLVQAGRLSLDDPLSKFLSTDWLPREMTDKIRIKHLLTHTSGLGSYFNERFMRSSRLLYRALDDYKPLVADSTLAFEPGTDWQYSNTGMFLLGVVIEKVAGQTYFDYVREHIHTPAGMINTDCYEMDQPVPNLAIGYAQAPSPDRPGWRNNLYDHVVKGGPAGGGFSTVEDLVRFAAALRAHKLLSPEYTEMVWTGKPELGSPEYGFGFGVSEGPAGRVVGHSGGFTGISATLDMYLDLGYTAAVLSNYDRGAPVVSSKIRALLSAGR